MIIRNVFILLSFTLTGFPTHIRADQTDKKPVKIFILAGQSNMEGKGTIKHLEQLISENAQEYGNLKSNGKWIERNDVWIDYLGNRGRRKKGN